MREAEASSFSSLGLDDRLLRALVALGYEEPTPIQREAVFAELDTGRLLPAARHPLA